MTSEAMKDERALLPCPFCGSPGDLGKRTNGMVYVGCDNEDDCPIHPYTIDAPANAVEQWNRRAALSASEKGEAHGPCAFEPQKFDGDSCARCGRPAAVHGDDETSEEKEDEDDPLIAWGVSDSHALLALRHTKDDALQFLVSANTEYSNQGHVPPRHRLVRLAEATDSALAATTIKQLREENAELARLLAIRARGVEPAAAIPTKDGGFRHEPLRQDEADAMWKAAKEQETKRATDMPTEQDAVRAMSSAYQRLKELGWRETMYGPTNETVLLIESGSSGIHEGYRSVPWPEKTWWIDDQGDSWPSNPCLFKQKATS